MADRPTEIYGINISELARICRVSIKTATRWKSGATCPPKSALMMVAADLGCFDRDWAGWTLRDGFLVSPEGWRVGTGEVLAIRILRQQLACYEVELRRLQAEALSVHDQPLPAEFPEWIFEKTA